MRNTYPDMYKEDVWNQLDLIPGIELDYTAEALVVLLDKLVDTETIKQVQPNKFTATAACGDEIDIDVSLNYYCCGKNPDSMTIEAITPRSVSTTNPEDDFNEV